MLTSCVNCGREFASRPSENRKYCGSECYRNYEAAHGRPRTAERQEFKCATCGKPFYRAAGELRAYRKLFGKDPMYCSRPCSWKAKVLPDERWQVNCVQCGKPMPVQRRPGGTINRQRKLCSTACRSLFRSERAPTAFREDSYSTHIKRGGYVWLSLPAWASPTGKKAQMLEHRYIMEKALGRKLRPEETVHHKNAQRSDNRLENLELFTSRHGPGARVRDQVEWAIGLLTDYPDYAADAGVKLLKTGEI